MDSGDLHGGASNFGEAMTIARHFVLLVATFIRWRLNKNLLPRGATSIDELVIE